MFPYTITIFTYDEDAESYSRQVVEGVWWTGSDSVSIGQAREHSASTTIVIPKEQMSDVKVANGCYIVKGEHKQIQTMEDLANTECIQVNSVQINGCGTELDNIAINGN